MHTRRLVAGEAFSLDEEKGFCLVVEGCVQIFIKSQQEDPTNANESDDEGFFSKGRRQGYQLLTEVRNGAPMSSLFSILSLFTEDIPTKDNAPNGRVATPPNHRPRHSFSRTANSSIAGPRLAVQRAHSHRKAKSQPNSQPGSPDIPGSHLKSVPPLTLDYT